MNLFSKKSNIQLIGNFKICNNIFSNDQFFQLLNKNIQWKSFVTYNKGDVCSRSYYNNNNIYCDFYYSVEDDNKNNDPVLNNSFEKWKRINLSSVFNRNIAFKIPEINYGINYVFVIQFSDKLDFSNLYTIKTSQINYLNSDNSYSSDNSYNSDNSYSSNIDYEQQYDFYISNNDIFVPLVKKTFSNEDSGKIFVINLRNIPSGYKYFRYYWHDGNIQSRYFFGVSDGQLYGVLQNTSSYQTICINNQNLFGDGSSLYPLKVNNNLKQIYSISSNKGIQLISQNSFISINSDYGNKALKIISNDILFNNNKLNSPNGLLKLDQNGHIPYDLYNQTDFSSRLLPIKQQVDIDCYGNPLVIYKDESVNQVIGNDGNVILLVQGTVLGNQAIGFDENITFEKNDLILYDDLFFYGGCKLITQLQYLSSSFQLDFEILFSTLNNRYKSIFQCYNGQEELFVLKINNQNISYSSINFTNDIQYRCKEILKFTLQYKYISQNSYQIKLYQQNTLIYQSTSIVQPFKNGQNKLYFMKTICDQSRNNRIIGFDGKWRNLRFSTQIKIDIDKGIGQLYSSQANVDFNTIKVNYYWENSNDIEHCSIFGKVNGKPCVLPYPQKSNYQLPVATNSMLGGVIIGNGLVIDQSGILSVSVDDDNKLDLGNYIQQNGNISIRSMKSKISSLTLQSGNLQLNQSGGKLFLGSEYYPYTELYWKNKNNGLYIDQEFVRLINSSSSYNTNSTRIDLTQDGYININSYTEDLRFNNNKINHPNGLVQLDSYGLIPRSLIPRSLMQEEPSLLNNSINIYNNSNQIRQVNGIKAGNRVSISIDQSSNIATINADQSGSFRQDQLVRYQDLENGLYKVQNVNVGCFVVQDSSGYLVMPVQRQINQNVYVDFSNWNFDKGDYKIRFIRGMKGQPGDATKNETLALIMSLCF